MVAVECPCDCPLTSNACGEAYSRPMKFRAQIQTSPPCWARTRASCSHTHAPSPFRFPSPALVKIGQALSARPDLLPRTYLEALSELQDRLPSFPTEIAMAVGMGSCWWQSLVEWYALVASLVGASCNAAVSPSGDCNGGGGDMAVQRIIVTCVQPEDVQLNSAEPNLRKWILRCGAPQDVQWTSV